MLFAFSTQFRIHRLATVFSGLFALTSTAVSAAGDAGALLQQTEQTPKLDKPATAVQRRTKPVLAVPKPGDVTVTVKRFAFVGNRLIDEGVLSAALSTYLQRPLSFNNLQAATALVTQTYRDAGWLVTAHLPRQDVSDGVVTIQITESVFGEVRVQSPPPKRVASERLVRTLRSQQTQGKPVKSARIDRALLLLDDLPGVVVTGQLQAGDAQGETHMLLQAVDEPLLQAEVGVDNHGAVATGVERVSLNAGLNSPLRLGDQLVINGLRSQGSDYLRLAYSAPLGHDGWRAQLRGTRMNHQLIGNLALTGARGSALTHGAEISYPLLRSLSQNLKISLGYDIKRYENYDSTGLTSRYETRASSLGAQGNHIGAAGATYTYAMSWIIGTVDLSDAPSAYALNIRNGPNTEGRYERLTLNLNRLQALTAGTSLWLSYTGQLANRNLDSSEKIYLEGPASVRAYGAGATGLGGSEGHILSAELRHNLDAQWRLTGFYDYGVATVNRNNQKADATGLISSINRYQLQGVGLSLIWQSSKGIQLKATVAQRIGLNPNAKSLEPRLDQDGTYRNPRFWLSASLPL